MSRYEYMSEVIEGQGGESAVDRWHRLFLEGKIDVAELEERLGPAIEYDDQRELGSMRVGGLAA